MRCRRSSVVVAAVGVDHLRLSALRVFSLVQLMTALPLSDGERKDKLPTANSVDLPIGPITLERSVPWDVKTPQAWLEAARLNKNWASGLASGPTGSRRDFSFMTSTTLGQCGRQKPERQPCSQNDGPQPRRASPHVYRWLDQADVAANLK